MSQLLTPMKKNESSSNIDDGPSKNKTELERLLDQKQYILEQLIEAIDDGKTILKHNNDSLTSINLKHVQDLYNTFLKDDTLRDFDMGTGAGAGEAANASTIDDGPGSNAVARRSSNSTAAARRHKELKLHLFDFLSLSSKKNKHKDKQKELNRIVMQGKIDEWLLNRQMEKKKIKNYMDRQKVDKQEECPKNGISRKKKRSNTRRNDHSKTKKKKSKYKGGNKYPCCRKCCKRSYMGCL